jgi:hypothetical protein
MQQIFNLDFWHDVRCCYCLRSVITSVHNQSKYLKRLVSDARVVALGVVVFASSVGLDKLQPSNVAWLSFRDQKTHWLGWQFFAATDWAWPPGLNPRYGWDSVTSIVATDSLPLFALVFKLLDIESVNNGQYFGISYLLGSILLCLGCSRLLEFFGVRGFCKFLGILLLVSSPIFWVMHEWYPALSAGMGLLVWSLHRYFYDFKYQKFSIRHWSVLLLAGVATQFYLFAIILGLSFATAVSVLPANSGARLRLIRSICVLLGVVVTAMYLIGYFATPIQRASAGSGYGDFSANLLGLVDFNGASRIIPDLPSTESQVDPTAIGLGGLILLVLLLAVRTKNSVKSVQMSIKKHWALTGMLAAMAIFSVSNVVSVGQLTLTIPLPETVVQSLSVFRSSSRFLWPSVMLLNLALVVLISRVFKKATVLLLTVVLIQLIDIQGSYGQVSQRLNGSTIDINYEAELWENVPLAYTTISHHRAGNYKGEWAECAYAALRSSRIAECAYLARVISLEEINNDRESLILGGTPPLEIIFWFDHQWVSAHLTQLVDLYDNEEHGFMVVPNGNGILFFPECSRFQNCQFLDGYRLGLEVALTRAAD